MATNEARSTRIQLRLSPTEADQLGKLSARLGVSKTQAVRQAVAALLGEPVAGQPEPVGSGAPGERALDFQLGRIRSNLKQLEPIGLRQLKFSSGLVDPVEAYERKVPQTVLERCLMDVEREKAACELRDQIGRPLAELVLRHNRGETVTSEQVHAVISRSMAQLQKKWTSSAA